MSVLYATVQAILKEGFDSHERRVGKTVLQQFFKVMNR